MRFAGKMALVTGAAGETGAAIVARLLSESAEVVGSDLHGTDLVDDLTDPVFADALAPRAADRMDRLDILVNNARIIRRGKITEATDADLALSPAVNVEAPFRTCRAAIPTMAASGGGAIADTAPGRGLHPGPDRPVYIMSKAAVASLTQCLGRDHAPQNIRVNAVCANEVDTPMLRSGFAVRGFDPDKAIEDLDASVPLGRIAQPEDIADVIAFRAPDEALHICGALVEVNGGKPVT